jgi:hypothetical protein
MERKTKYVKGEAVTSIDELLSDIHAGRFVYLNGVPKHPLWLHCMTLQTIEGFVRNRRLHHAVRRDGAVRCAFAESCDFDFCIHHSVHEYMGAHGGCGPSSYCRYRRENVGCVPVEEPCSQQD